MRRRSSSQLPVIVTPYAGVAGELVLDGENGFIEELDADLWAQRGINLPTHQMLTKDDVNRIAKSLTLALSKI